MKCAEINSWINSVSETELQSPSETITEHILVCNKCKERVTSIQQSFIFINNQKLNTLSEEKSVQIIEHLLSPKYVLTPKLANARFIISRVAVILIIAFGLLTGIIAGRLLFSDSDSNSNPWSNEFTLLSDNTDYLLFD